MMMIENTSLSVGEVIKGKVTKVEFKVAFVDIGYKFDAILPITEVSCLHLEKVADQVSVGEDIECKILRIDEEKEEVIISKKAIDADKAWAELQNKFANNETVITTVADTVKGGLVVDLGVRGFIPASLVDVQYIEDLSMLKGQEIACKILEIEMDNNRLILSRKAVLAEEQDLKQAELINDVKVGQIIEGSVQRLTNFGAFVDIGGIDGLVHVSELAWQHVEHPAEVLKVGEKIKVKVLKVDTSTGRVSLSIKETEQGPWDKAFKELKVGSIISGEVKRLTSFGAFVEVYPSVEGLVHISQLSDSHVNTPEDFLKVGETVSAKVLELDAERKRIGLSIKDAHINEKRQPEQKVALSSNNLNVTLGDVYPELSKLNKV